MLNDINELNNGLASKSKNEPIIRKEASMFEILRLAKKVIKEQTSIFLIGDFLNLDDASLIEIRSLARKNKLLAIHVFDPIETQAPPPNLYSITDGFERFIINTNDKEFTKSYSKHYENKLERIYSNFSEINSPVISISTGESIETIFFKNKLINLK